MEFLILLEIVNLKIRDKSLVYIVIHIVVEFRTEEI